MRKLMCLAVLVLVAAGAPPATAQASQSDHHVLSACQDLIRKSVHRFANDVHDHAGRCALHGLTCLLRQRSLETCCARAAHRCADDVRKMEAAERRFMIRMADRTCSRVAFDDIVNASGLDFSDAIAACHCLEPPVEVVDLQTLTECMSRVTARDTIDLIAAAEVPRVREALGCMGLDGDFPGVLEQSSTSSDCGGSPTPSASAGGATATLVASVTPGPTATAAATGTPLVTPAASATATGAPTSTVLVTSTATATPGATATPTPMVTSTGLATSGPTSTLFATDTPVASSTPGASSTPVESSTPVASSTPGRTFTALPTDTSVATASPTPTPSPTAAPTPIVVPVCGNGMVEGNEQCDGKAVDTTFCFEDICTCEDFCDDVGGTLSCNPDCTLNFSGCTAGGCAF